MKNRYMIVRFQIGSPQRICVSTHDTKLSAMAALAEIVKTEEYVYYIRDMSQEYEND